MRNPSVYIVDALRTPMGRAHGRLAACSVSFFSQCVLKALAEKNALFDAAVDEVIIGSAVPAGAGQNFVRGALIGAGLPESVPGYSVGNVCASGLQAVICGQRAVMARCADLVLAAGVESVSQMPEYLFKTHHEIKKIKGWTEGLMHDGLLCSMTGRSMGSLCEEMARQERILKKEQDDYAFDSYQKAARAYEQDFFQDEMIPLTLTGNKIFWKDETLRTHVKREVFDSFEGAFETHGTVTAGNSSAPCDGAAGVLLASFAVVKARGFHPLARILSGVSVAGKPGDVFRLVPEALNACLQKAGLTLKQIDLFEISEAFAAQMVFTKRQIPDLEGKVNVYGGDIALGHPLGAAGIRAMVTLVHALKRQKKRFGIVCAALGGGGALAVCLENRQI